MKVYIAAPWVRKAEAVAAGEKFKAADHVITSRWFTHEGDPADPTGKASPDDQIRQQAMEDISDVLQADVLVVLNLEKSEGKAVETGIALANEIPIVSVGPRSNIFQTLGIQVGTIEEALDVLAR